jgi:DHA1 family bicyclomycin/chloramphenicol resistance-like MFS transporter
VAVPSQASMSKLEFVALMAALMAADALAIDIMLPALPAMGDALGVANANDRAWILTTFLIGFGVPQLVFGPITDRFGRRSMILIGLAAYIVTTLACAVSPTFAVLLVARFLQGTAAAAVRVAMMATVRDRYSGRAMAEIMSLVLAVFLLVPIICPSIGQLILFVGPWPLIFVFIATLGAIFWVWSYLRLSESLAPQNRRALDFSVVVEGFQIVLTNRRAFFYGIIGAFMYGIIVGMISTAQQTYVEIYGLGEWFPVAFGVMALIAAGATLVVSRVVRAIGMRRVGHGALGIIIIAAAFFGLWSLSGPLPLWAFYLMLLVTFPSIVSVFNTTGALSMEPLGEVAGTASSVFGAINTVGGAGFGLVIAQLYNGTITPVLFGNGVIALMALVCVLIAERGQLFGRDHVPVAAAPIEVL